MTIPLTIGNAHLYPGQGGSGGYTGYTGSTNSYSALRNPVVKPPPGPGYGGGYGGATNEQLAPAYTPAGITDPSHGYGTPGGTGNNVDWASMIGGSYEVSQAEAMMGAQMARAKANLQNSLRMNLIDLGVGSKADLGDLSKYIDKATLTQAINNKYSVYAQVADQQARANATNDAQLAARGILSSGQTTKSTQDVVNQGEQARYTGLRDFLRSGQTGLEHLGDVESQMAQGVMQARFAAAARLAQQYATAGMGGGTALGGAAPVAAAPPAAAQYDPYTDPNFPGGPAAPNYPLVGTDSAAWLNWLKEHGTTGY
jgi:hypothetical protein